MLFNTFASHLQRWVFDSPPYVCRVRMFFPLGILVSSTMHGIVIVLTV